MTESGYTRKLKAMLENRGALVVPMVAGMRTMPGLPDRYVSHWRFRGWIECKEGRNKLSDIQVHVAAELLKRGETVLVLRFRETHFWCIEHPVDGEELAAGSPEEIVQWLLK